MNTTHQLKKQLLVSSLLKYAKLNSSAKTNIISSFRNKAELTTNGTESIPKRMNCLNITKKYRTHAKYLTHYRAGFSSVQSSQRKYIIDNKYLDKTEKDDETEVFLIYINRPFDVNALKSFHKLSSYTIMADGGANRLHEKFQSKYVSTTYRRDEEIIPDVLIGDFDSLRLDVLDYYQERGANIIHNLSQDNSDLEKCLNHLDKKFIEEDINNQAKFYRILIAGGFGGRVDHTLNNVHVLHKFAEKYTDQENISLHLIDDNSIGTCILPGKTTYIKANKFERNEGCGLFPLVDAEANVKTKGLKWNIGAPKTPSLNFMNFISSSNEMVDETVEIETDKIIFWLTTNNISKDEYD